MESTRNSVYCKSVLFLYHRWRACLSFPLPGLGLSCPHSSVLSMLSFLLPPRCTLFSQKATLCCDFLQDLGKAVALPRGGFCRAVFEPLWAAFELKPQLLPRPAQSSLLSSWLVGSPDVKILLRASPHQRGQVQPSTAEQLWAGYLTSLCTKPSQATSR